MITCCHPNKLSLFVRLPASRPQRASRPQLLSYPHPAKPPAPQESGEPWTAASEVQLCYEVKTFLLAGHETSSAMLCWSFYELSQNQAALDKVRQAPTRSQPLRAARSRARGSAALRMAGPDAGPAPAAAGPRVAAQLGAGSPPTAVQVRAEAAAVFPAGAGADAVPSREAVDGMEYCLAVLKEALRKYSVVPVVTRNLNAVGGGGAGGAGKGHVARLVRCAYACVLGSMAGRVQGFKALHARIVSGVPGPWLASGRRADMPALGCPHRVLPVVLTHCLPLCAAHLHSLPCAGRRAAGPQHPARLLADRAPAGHSPPVRGERTQAGQGKG